MNLRISSCFCGIACLLFFGAVGTLGPAMASEESPWVKEEKKACDGGNAKVCYDLAEEFDSVFYYKKACDLGFGAACVQGGSKYYRGDGVQQDYGQAKQFFETGCDRGDANSCGQLGNLYYFGDGVTKDFVRAAKLYAVECDRGSGAACSSLAEMYELGQGMRPDRAKAAQLYAKACKKHDEPSSCKESNRIKSAIR